MAKVQVFYHPYNRRPENVRVAYVEVELDAAPDASWDALLLSASLLTGIKFLARGTWGAFEIQTDHGIWSHVSGEEKALSHASARFQSWEELDSLPA